MSIWTTDNMESIKDSIPKKTAALEVYLALRKSLTISILGGVGIISVLVLPGFARYATGIIGLAVLVVITKPSVDRCNDLNQNYGLGFKTMELPKQDGKDKKNN